MNNPREFHLGDVLSITTGRLVSPSVMDGMYAICEHLAGEAVWTHQLPRVADEAKPVLLSFYPELADIDYSGITQDNWREWLAEQVERYGETRAVPQLSVDEHESIDPLSEAAEMVPPGRILAVES